MAIIPIVFALSYSLGVGKTENAIRLTGLVLQLAGILTVVWGLVATWRFFGLGDPVASIIAWVQRFPLKRRTISASMHESTLAGDTMSARGSTSWPLDPNSSLEVRITALEKNIPLLQERITQTQAELDRAIGSLRAELNEAVSATAEKVAKVDIKVNALGTGSLHISGIGALWLFVGSILGSASPNLAAWVQ